MKKRIGSSVIILVLLIVCIVGGYHSRYDNTELFRSQMESLLRKAGIDKENDEEYLDHIRNYAYANLEWASGSNYYQDMEKAIFEEALWEEAVYFLYCEDTIEATGYCGGTAYALATLYNVLGYNACALDMAVFDQAGKVMGSQVVTLVELEDRWIVEDATFNLTYKEDGEHISIQDLVKSVKESEIQNIKVEEGTEKYKRVSLEEPQ